MPLGLSTFDKWKIARQLIKAIFDTIMKMVKQKKSMAQFTVYATY